MTFYSVWMILMSKKVKTNNLQYQKQYMLGRLKISALERCSWVFIYEALSIKPPNQNWTLSFQPHPWDNGEDGLYLQHLQSDDSCGPVTEKGSKRREHNHENSEQYELFLQLCAVRYTDLRNPFLNPFFFLSPIYFL